MGAILSSKTELLTEKKRAYEEFTAAIDVVRSDPDLQPPGEDWSPKDVVAHVAYWEDYFSKSLLAWLIAGTPFPGFESYDEINDHSTALSRSEQLSSILHALETAHRAVTTIVEEMISDETLHQEVPVAYASRVGDRPLGEMIVSYVEHYTEHAAQLRSMG